MKSTADELEQMMLKVNEVLADYIRSSQSGEGRIARQVPASELLEKLSLGEWIKEGGMTPENVVAFLEPYLEHSQRMHHPHYIGHQVSVPHLISGVADFVHGASNNPMAIYEMGPSATVIEKFMINWLLEKAGWLGETDLSDFSDSAGKGAGVFTHGGSLANLTALLSARAASAPNAWDEGVPENLYVICSEVSHYSVARAISIIGMGKNKILAIEVDENERIKPQSLRKMISQANSEGKNIMAVIANACATSTGLYDPLDEIGQICREENLWFHVDGAHGASALLSDQEKHLMKGLEYADSMIWDTHKMLRTSTLSAVVLFRDAHRMVDTFQQKGSYLFHEKENLGYDLMPFTIECTKAPLATKLFWVLAAQGEKGLADFITQQYSKTREFHDYLAMQADFECPYYPEANILCFRFKKFGLDNEFQLELRNQLVLEGKFYITSTEIRGTRYLRMTVINPLTEIEHIMGLVQELRSLATRMVH